MSDNKEAYAVAFKEARRHTEQRQRAADIASDLVKEHGLLLSRRQGTQLADIIYEGLPE